MSSKSASSTAALQVPENFVSLIQELCTDLATVYPERAAELRPWMGAGGTDSGDGNGGLVYRHLFEYCLVLFPPRVFDILYKNDDIFLKPSKDVNVCFLPGINFADLYRDRGVSVQTQETIWKYLQSILLTVLGSVKDSSMFGKAGNLFEAMNEEEMEKKLAETMNELTSFFGSMEENFARPPEGAGVDAGVGGDGDDDRCSEEASESTETGSEGDGDSDEDDDPNDPKNAFNPKKMFGKLGGGKMPDLNFLQEHMKSLMEGKLGRLAREFSEEFVHDAMRDWSEEEKVEFETSEDFMRFLTKDPSRMLAVFKKAALKMQEKLSNGEISQEDLMKEMTALLEKMKTLGNEKEFKDILKNLTKSPMMKMMAKKFSAGAGGGNGAARVDMSALHRMQKQAHMKDRLRAKLEARKQAAAAAALQAHVASMQTPPATNDPHVFVMGDEIQEKTTLEELRRMKASAKSSKKGL